MLNKPPGLRERNRIRTRDEILVATSIVLGKNGYQGTTLDDVAAEAGVSRASLYTYFPEGREQLVREAYQRISDLVSTAGLLKRDEHDEVIERILALAIVLVSFATTPEGRFYGLMGHDVIEALTGHQDTSGSASRRFNAILVEDLGRAAGEGALSTGAPVEALAVLLSGALREIGVVAAREPGRAAELIQGLRMTCEALLSTGVRATT